MLHQLVLAAALFTQTVSLTGEFENLLSRGCYPIRLDVAALPQVRTFLLNGIGVRFHQRGGNCEGEGLGDAIKGTLPPGETLALEVDMQRDLVNDARVNAAVAAAAYINPLDGSDGEVRVVRFVDPTPLIVLEPLFLVGQNPNALDRDGCFFFRAKVFPETMPITVTLISSGTNGVPDLEIHGNGCGSPLVSSLDLPAEREPSAWSVFGSYRLAPGNTGTSGTLTISSPTLVDGVAFTPVARTFTFAPPAPPPPPVITLSGQFENLASHGCHPIRLDVAARPEARTFALSGAGVVFFPADVSCDGAAIGNVIEGAVPAGTPLALAVNMQRDLDNDTRVAASVSAAAGEDTAMKGVTFSDPAPLIVLTPLFREGNTNLDRNGCYFMAARVFPETMAITVNVASSATRGVPDLEPHGNGCDTPVLTTLNLAADRDPDDTHFIASVKRAPRNAGTTGTLTVSSPTLVDGVAFAPVVETYTFKPRATLSLTAPATTNLPADACLRATVRVGKFDFPSIRVRLYSGTGNARVYSTSGCLTTLTEVTLPPNGTRDVWLKPVAPDVPQASLIADTSTVPNVEPTRPPAAGLSFYFTQ